MLLEKNQYWPLKNNDPYLYLVEDTLEFIDVDIEKDFVLAEMIYKNNFQSAESDPLLRTPRTSIFWK